MQLHERELADVLDLVEYDGVTDSDSAGLEVHPELQPHRP